MAGHTTIIPIPMKIEFLNDFVGALHRMGWERRMLILVIFIAAFLRGYHFHDWLRFNPDQARDAAVVFEMTRGHIPLLGPPAGGTDFQLGPITHYFSYISGTFFGFSPDSLAYPDLLFSILTVPLIFFLVTRMFGEKLGLLAASLSAVSGFMVRYGRFQWNPNTMPFFTALFLLSAALVLSSEGRRQRLWAAVFGISLGVGVQLHTFLLVLLPLLALGFFLMLFFEKKLSFGVAGIAIGTAAFLNIPFALSEVQNDFSNTGAFFEGLSAHTEDSPSFFNRLGRDALCHVRADAFILSGLGNSDDCNRFASVINKTSWGNPLDSTIALIEIMFTVGGFLLLGMSARREKNSQKRFLLAAVLAYSIALFLLIIPVANEIAMRYFLASAFVPFVLLAAWGSFLSRKGAVFRAVFWIFVLTVFISNVWFLKEEFDSFQSGKVSDGDTSVLGEVEPLAEFIARNTPEGGASHLIGMRSYRKRFHRAIEYSLLREGKSIVRWEGKGLPEKPGPVFLIRKKTRAFDAASEIDGRPILDRVSSGRVSVFLIRRE